MIYREEKLREDMNLHGLHVLLAEDNDLISVITKYIEVIAKGKFFEVYEQQFRYRPESMCADAE